VGDGGIDAFIENANPSADDIIPIGSSGASVCRAYPCSTSHK
jgi:hypothetical protein